ncbi:MAG TPA: phospholipase D-like domain-containing protein [Candidatus Acidoferrales bacterium]|nr:phospholipase D-like domain-containing protein [Candidatus Acidoferrales bacterium]
MRLLVQPDDGVAPLLAAIKCAKKSIEIVIFRFDRKEIETALKAAVQRGVFVHALIAYANRGGEQHLRQLELRLLDEGVTVARTANDLVRYHDKMMLIDRTTLYVLSFNYTALDIQHSRGFGIVTRNGKFVREAIRLFESDTKRKPYKPALDTFLVSPLNARRGLAAFLRKAKKELLIYDPKISDYEMAKILSERQKAGVLIKVIGRLGKRTNGLSAEKLTNIRLHTRTIIRDRQQAFVGSQSLRKLELDSRRELGLVVRDSKVVKRLADVFESDWVATEAGRPKERAAIPKFDEKELRKTARVIEQELPQVANTVKKVVRRIVAKAGEEAFQDEKVQSTVKKAVKKVVKEAMKEVVESSPLAPG